MGKRSSFAKNERSLYPTPLAPVRPLIPFLAPGATFIEPCAGDGRLVGHLESFGLQCVYASDVVPGAKGIAKRNALDLDPYPKADYVITNPPWDRDKASDYLLHKLIERFVDVADTWLLLDADWSHTIQAIPYEKYCKEIVPVGRVKWIENSKHTGKDNCAWHKFNLSPGRTIFHFRVDSKVNKARK